MKFIRLFLLALALASGGAHAVSVSGTVYAGGSPMQGATVALINASTSALLGPIDTDEFGQYLFVDVPPATYNLEVSPAPATPYTSATISGIVVAGTNVVQDVILVAGSHILSGVVRLTDGRKLTGARVQVTVQETGAPLPPVTTDINGEFSVAVVTGVYVIDVLEGSDTSPQTGVDGARPAAMPYYFKVEAAAASVSVYTNTYRVIEIAFAEMTGRTVDPSAVPVPDVAYRFQGGATNCTVVPCTTWTVIHDGISDAGGNYALWVFAGTYTIALAPPVTATAVAQTTLTGVNIAASGTLDLAVRAGFVLSGVVSLPDGRKLTSATIEVRPQSPGGSVPPLVYTDAAGAFAIPVAAGTYAIDVREDYYQPVTGVDGTFPPGIPDYYEIINAAKNVAVSAPTTANITVPFVVLSGRTVDNGGTVIPNVDIAIYGGASDCATAPCTTRYIYHEGVSSGSGNYVVWLLPATYTAQLFPPLSATTVAQTQVTGISVAATQTLDLVLQGALSLSGRVRLFDGRALSGASIQVSPQTPGGSEPLWITTDATGAFSAPVVPGTYTIDVFDLNVPPTAGVNGVRLAGMPDTFRLVNIAKNVVVNANTVHDITAPFVVLSGKTTDSNAVPVPGTSFDIFIFHDDCAVAPCTLYRLFKVGASDGGGNYLAWLFPGPVNLGFDPPPGSGFASSVETNINVTGTQQLNLLLSLPDTRAPKILSGPFVKPLSASRALVEWLTDEPATGAVTIGGNTYNENAFPRTLHSVEVTGLAPSTPYVAQVSSADLAGNAPVTSSSPFTTAAAGDTNPPLFTGGPVVTAVTQDSATVEWDVDEPATGVVAFGTTPALGTNVAAPVAATRQRVTLTGLNPATSYYAQVGATDAAANGPAQSAVVSFTTQAAADLSPPAIIGKPAVLEITSTAATISWNTDEPANSGVSWNNGIAYGVAKDDAFVTHHAVRIPGLVPGTAYTATVSSKDAPGNGPTLSSITFTTLPSGDVQPPVITCGPEAINVKQRSAYVRWCTGEPASALVRFGTSSANLPNAQSRSSLATTHLVGLTNLAAGTTYHFRIESRDVAGNASPPGPVLSFTTPSAADAPLAFTQPPTAIYQSDTRITVAWATNAPADATLTCTPQAGGEARRAARAERLTNHQLTISNLQSNLSYTCQAQSVDMTGNAVVQ